MNEFERKNKYMNQSRQAMKGALVITGIFLMILVSPWIQAQESVVRVLEHPLELDATEQIDIQLQALGNENGLSFSIVWNPEHINVLNISEGAGLADRSGTLVLNENQRSDGRLGVSMVLSPGDTFPLGDHIILSVSLTVLGTVDVSSVGLGFGDSPVEREVGDEQANILSSRFIQSPNLVVDRQLAIQPVPTQTTREDRAFDPITVNVSGRLSGPGLTLTAVSGNTALIRSDQILISGTGLERTLNMKPVPDAFGSALITLRLTDGVSEVTTTFSANVQEVDDPPTLGLIPQLPPFPESSEPQVLELSGISAGPPNEDQNVTVTATSSNPALVEIVGVEYNSPGSDGRILFKTGRNQDGTAQIVIRVSDGNNEVMGIANIRVFAVNDPPVLDPFTDQISIPEGQPFTTRFSAQDEDSTSFRFVVEGSVPAGLSLDTRSGEFSWTPNESQGPGEYPLIIKVIDDGQAERAAPFHISVTEVNRAPQFPDLGNLTATEDVLFELELVASDPDIPANEIQYELLEGPEGLEVDVNGKLLWTPSEVHSPGTFQVRVAATDNGQPPLTTETAITLLVREVNDPPFIVAPESLVVLEDELLLLEGMRIDDPDTTRPGGAPAILDAGYQVNLSVQEGILIAGSDTLGGGLQSVEVQGNLAEINDALARLQYRGRLNFSGEDVLSVEVRELGLSEVDQRAIPISVTAVNDPPFILELPDVETLDGARVEPILFTVDDPDSNPESLRVAVSSDNNDLLPEGSLQLTMVDGRIALNLQPAPGLSGEARVEIKAVDDEEAESVRSFLLIVSGRAPIITVNPIPQNLISGGTLDLKAEAVGTLPLTYQWFFSSAADSADAAIIEGATSASLVVSNVSPIQTGFYVIRVENDLGQVFSRPVRVNVVGEISIATQPQSQSVSAGAAVEFSVVLAPGSGTVQYQWFQGNNPIKSANQSVLRLAAVKPGDSGEYWVRMVNARGTVESARAVLRVGVPVRITRQPDASLQDGILQVVEGEKFILGVGFEGSKPANVQWQFEVDEVFQNIQGANSNQFEGVATAAASGRYRVVIANTVNGVEFSRVTSANVTLDVLVPVRIVSVTRTPENGRVIEGSAFQFQVDVEGDARNLRYQWQRNGKNIENANGETFGSDAASFQDSGDYTVVVNNIASRPATSQPQSLFVIRPVVIGGDLIQVPPSNRLRAGSSVQFVVNFKGTAPFSVTWRKDGTAVDLTDPRITVVLNENAQWARMTIDNLQGTDSGSYDAVLNNEAARPVTSSSRGITVTQPTLVTPGFAQQIVTLGQDVDLTVSIVGDDGPYLVEWLLNGQSTGLQGESITLNNISRQQLGSYIAVVEGQTQNPVESSPMILIPDIPEQSFADDFENKGVLAGDNGLIRSNNTGATRQANEPNAGSSVWATLAPTVSGLLRLDTQGSAFDTILAVYTGDSLDNLQHLERDRNSGGFLTSQLEVSVTGGQLYQIALYGNGNAQGGFVFNWSLESTPVPKPRITTNPTGVTVQEGGAAFFTVQVAPPPVGFQPTYQWTKDSVDLNNERSSTLSLADLQIADAGKLSVRVAFVQVGIDPTLTPFPTNVPIAQSARVNLIVTEQPSDEVFISESFFDLFGDGGFGLLNRESIFRDTSTPPVQLHGATIATAVELAGFATGGFASTQSFKTTGTFKEPGEPNHCGETGGASQWSFFIPEVSGTVRLSTDGSDFDTVLAVYTLNPPGLGFGDLVEVACDNDSGLDGEDSVVVFPVVAGETYYTVIDGVGGTSGFVTLSSSLAGSPVVLNLVGNPVSNQSQGGNSSSVALQNLRLLSAEPTEAVVPEGGDIQISVTASNAFSQTPYQYQWFFGVSNDDFREIEGETNQVLNLQNVGPNEEGLYKVRVSNFAGESDDEETPILLLEIQSAPVIFEISDGRQVLPGSNQELSVGVSGSEPINFQWFFNSFQNAIAGATGRTLVLESVEESEVGDYFVRAVNSFGQAEGSVTLALDTLVGILTQPQSQILSAGSSLALSVVATGSDLTYQWTFEGEDIEGETQSSLNINSVQAVHAGVYSVTVSSETQTVVSDDALVEIDLPLSIVQAPQSLVVNQGSSAAFTVAAQGNPAPTFQWSFGGTPLAGETASTLVLNDVQQANSGSYTVEVTSGADVLTVGATLTVTEADTLRIEAPQFSFDQAGNLIEIQISVIGVAGESYVVERTQEPTATAIWETVEVVTLESDSAVVTIDIQGEPLGFFRVRQQ